MVWKVVLVDILIFTKNFILIKFLGVGATFYIKLSNAKISFVQNFNCSSNAVDVDIVCIILFGS